MSLSHGNTYYKDARWCGYQKRPPHNLRKIMCALNKYICDSVMNSNIILKRRNVFSCLDKIFNEIRVLHLKSTIPYINNNLLYTLYNIM